MRPLAEIVGLKPRTWKVRCPDCLGRSTRTEGVWSRKPRFQDGRTYDVLVDGETIGQVHSYREASWRQLPSGVRYGFRGRPQFWSYTGNERRHLYRRKDAVAALLTQHQPQGGGRG